MAQFSVSYRLYLQAQQFNQALRGAQKQAHDFASKSQRAFGSMAARVAASTSAVNSSIVRMSAKMESSLVRGMRGFNNFNQRLSVSSSRMAASLDGMGSTVRNWAIGLAASLALPIRSIFAFEKAMNGVRAVTNASAEDMARFRDQAKQLGASTMFSAGQVGAAQEAMAMAGLQTKQILDGMPGVLSLAASSGAELGRVADVSTNVMSAFSLEAKELGRVSDVMAAAMSRSNVNFEQLSGALVKSAPLANTTGQSLEELVAVIGALGNIGVKAEVAGTAIAGSMARMINPVGEAKDIMDQYGLSFRDAQGQMLPYIDILKQMQKAEIDQADLMKLLGQESGRYIIGLIDQGKNLEKIRDITKEVVGEADRMARIRQSGLPGAWLEFKSALEGVSLALGDSGVKGAIEVTLDSLTVLARGLIENKELLKSIVTGIKIFAGGIAVALPTLIAFSVGLKLVAATTIAWTGALKIAGIAVTVFGKAKVLMLALAPAMAVVKGAFLALNVVMTANPIGAIIVGVTALTVAGIALYKNWDKIVGMFKRMWEWLKKIIPFLSAFKAVKGAISTAKQQIQADNELVAIEDAKKRGDYSVESFKRLQSVGQGVNVNVGGEIIVSNKSEQNVDSNFQIRSMPRQGTGVGR